VTEDELIQTYPRLYHMAHDGAWEAIRVNGLMSTTALLDAYHIEGDERVTLRSRRRPESVPLAADGLPGAVLRDQKPMHDSALVGCLRDGLTPQDWYETLNSRSFFWLSKERIWRLLKARAYRDVRQTVLTIDTASLVTAHSANIWLSPINSGSTLFNPQPRGNDTFSRIPDFPFADRKRARSSANNVVELVVDHSVPDIADHVLAVHSVRNADILEEIWRSADAAADDHP
jgi:hypothetical protein